MDNGEVPSHIKRLQEYEALENAARKVKRRTARYIAFIPGFIWGVILDFTTTGNSIFGMIVGPFFVGIVFSFLVTLLMMAFRF